MITLDAGETAFVRWQAGRGYPAALSIVAKIDADDGATERRAALTEAAAAIRHHAQPANNAIRPSINAKHVYHGYELAAQIIDRMVAES